MFDQIFLSSQVKRSAIISNEHGLYELPHQLPNDFRLNAPALSPLGGRTFPHKKKKKKKRLWKIRNISKCQNPKNEIFSILTKTS